MSIAVRISFSSVSYLEYFVCDKVAICHYKITSVKPVHRYLETLNFKLSNLCYTLYKLSNLCYTLYKLSNLCYNPRQVLLWLNLNCTNCQRSFSLIYFRTNFFNLQKYDVISIYKGENYGNKN
jgi:hypothetical protein